MPGPIGKEDVGGTGGVENSSDGKRIEGAVVEEVEFEGTASVVVTAGVKLHSGFSSEIILRLLMKK